MQLGINAIPGACTGMGMLNAHVSGTAAGLLDPRAKEVGPRFSPLPLQTVPRNTSPGMGGQGLGPPLSQHLDQPQMGMASCFQGPAQQRQQLAKLLHAHALAHNANTSQPGAPAAMQAQCNLTLDKEVMAAKMRAQQMLLSEAAGPGSSRGASLHMQQQQQLLFNHMQAKAAAMADGLQQQASLPANLKLQQMGLQRLQHLQRQQQLQYMQNHHQQQQQQQQQKKNMMGGADAHGSWSESKFRMFGNASQQASGMSPAARTAMMLGANAAMVQRHMQAPPQQLMQQQQQQANMPQCGSHGPPLTGTGMNPGNGSAYSMDQCSRKRLLTSAGGGMNGRDGAPDSAVARSSAAAAAGVLELPGSPSKRQTTGSASPILSMGPHNSASCEPLQHAASVPMCRPAAVAMLCGENFPNGPSSERAFHASRMGPSGLAFLSADHAQAAERPSAQQQHQQQQAGARISMGQPGDARPEDPLQRAMRERADSTRAKAPATAILLDSIKRAAIGTTQLERPWMNRAAGTVNGLQQSQLAAAANMAMHQAAWHAGLKQQQRLLMSAPCSAFRNNSPFQSTGAGNGAMLREAGSGSNSAAHMQAAALFGQPGPSRNSSGPWQPGTPGSDIDTGNSFVSMGQNMQGGAISNTGSGRQSLLQMQMQMHHLMYLQAQARNTTDRLSGSGQSNLKQGPGPDGGEGGVGGFVSGAGNVQENAVARRLTRAASAPARAATQPELALPKLRPTSNAQQPSQHKQQLKVWNADNASTAAEAEAAMQAASGAHAGLEGLPGMGNVAVDDDTDLQNFLDSFLDGPTGLFMDDVCMQEACGLDMDVGTMFMCQPLPATGSAPSPMLASNSSDRGATATAAGPASVQMGSPLGSATNASPATARSSDGKLHPTGSVTGCGADAAADGPPSSNAGLPGYPAAAAAAAASGVHGQDHAVGGPADAEQQLLQAEAHALLGLEMIEEEDAFIRHHTP